MSEHRHGRSRSRVATGQPARGARRPHRRRTKDPKRVRPAQPFWAPRASDMRAVRPDWDEVFGR